MRDKRAIMSSLTNMSIYLVKLCEVRIMSFEELKEVFVDLLNLPKDTSGEFFLQLQLHGEFLKKVSGKRIVSMMLSIV